MAFQIVDIYERLDMEAQDGDIEGLYELIAEYPNILEHFDNVSFCETPLHIAAEKGQTHFAMELMNLKPSLALKLNVSGFSPMHLALQNNHIRMVRGFLAMDSSLVSIKGRGRITPLHYVAQLAVHVAVKSQQFMAFKVLLGWVRRVNREEILDWKDEDGNTVFHIAASMNQTEVMKLLRNTVNVKAKNLDGKTAMDILETDKSPIFPKATTLFRSAKERLLFGPSMSLAGYLSREPSTIEGKNKLLGLNNLSKTKHGSRESTDFRNAILVVAVLIVTATYQAGLSPPGGYWEDDSPNDGHTAGQMTMSFNLALFFYILNGVAFFSSLYVIMVLIIGLPMWMVLYGSTAALGMANYASYRYTFPHLDGSFGNIALALVWFAYQ
ncbi:ankyrin repeat-containing protein BDA1-like isoform X2 [Brassica napus]|uniref:ankyrin repeat-containing protein BDA1-like isoform X2 n=1 Tax=Brassica napus TaxID=3708 RepID=UPI00207A895C|nr:ankyrin repeat-containing protein BDA1-like isoform X2 [Brassica napus]